MVGLLHKTELWDKEDKSLYLTAKDFNLRAAKGNVQTKADVEEKAKDSTPY